MKLMRQTDAKEITAIAKAIYAAGGKNKDAERSRIVVLYGEDSRATKLFDYVNASSDCLKLAVTERLKSHNGKNTSDRNNAIASRGRKFACGAAPWRD